MTKPFIPVILGSARNGRQSEKVAKYFFNKLKADSRLDTEFVDVKDFVSGRTIPSWEKDPAAEPWRQIAAKAHAFFFVVPEYNHGYPGEFKMLIDQESKKVYNNKKAVLCSVSDGPFGGARMRENLLPILHNLAFQVLTDPLYVMGVDKLFIEPESSVDAIYAEKLQKILAQLI